MPTPSKHSPCVGIRTCSDYSPFGVELDGRTVSGGYRFGFQGSEKDNEFKGDGNSYTTEFRQLDPRLGRWLSVDALYYKSPDWTPYRFGFNNPIYINDISGLFESKDDAKSYKRENHIRGKISYNSKNQHWEITNKKYSYSAGNDLGVAEMSQFKNDGVIQSTIVHSGKNSKAQQNQGKWIDNFQTTLDIAGIFDPTGIVDGVNAIIYASRGEWVNAGISALAIVPYIGDLGKGGRLGTKLVAKGGATVLGHYPNYVKLAESIGARRFQIPTKVWNKMSESEQWAANAKFLDRMILRGDNIRLATPINKVKPGSFFQKELNYLIEKGYKVSSDGLWLIK